MGIKTSVAATLVLIGYLVVLTFVYNTLLGAVADGVILVILTVLSFLLAFNARIEKSFPVLLWRLFNMALAVAILGYLAMLLLVPATAK